MLKKIVNILINFRFFNLLIYQLSDFSYKLLSLEKYVEYKKSNSFSKVSKFIKDPIVMKGPFKGLNYRGIESFCSTINPKLFGTYEAELHDIIKKIIKKNYQRIVDIGSAEGYYAVGIPYAKKDQEIEVVAIEISKIAIKNLRKLVKNNIKNQVTINDKFESKKYYDNKETIVIMDCEGAELDYLRKIDKEYILKWDFLIEIHVQKKKNIIKELEEIFKERKILKIKSLDDYHKIEEYSESLPEYFDDNTKLLLLSENRRSGMYWFYIN